MDHWIEKYAALHILKDLDYSEMDEQTKEYYKALTIGMENLIKDYENENKEN